MLAPEYYRRMGQCLMHAGSIDAATAAHEIGRTVAQRFGAWEHELANRLGLAAVRLAAGDIRGSDRTFADVMRDAELWRLPYVRAEALHERALAAYERTGDEARRAVVWLYEAYGLYDEGVRRDDALDDLASVFIALQLLDVARDIYHHFVVLADDPDRVVSCGLKGLRLAAQRGDAAEFEFYAARLAREEMHPPQLAEYFLALGLGHWRRGRLSRARAAYSRAMRIGELYRQLQALHDAEQARSRLDAGVAPPPPLVATTAEPTAPVARVIAAIRTIYDAPGVATPGVCP
jgi:tetratricopeptide (TPR) repeat protein